MNEVNFSPFDFMNFSNFSDKDITMMNPLEWAYIGDVVYELCVRSYIMGSSRGGKVEYKHKESVKFVKAKAQSEFLEAITDMLTEEEQNVVRRGRNTRTSHVPKNADVIDYRRATAFEALMGYLFLMKRYDRLRELISFVFEFSKGRE